MIKYKATNNFLKWVKFDVTPFNLRRHFGCRTLQYGQDVVNTWDTALPWINPIKYRFFSKLVPNKKKKSLFGNGIFSHGIIKINGRLAVIVLGANDGWGCRRTSRNKNKPPYGKTLADLISKFISKCYFILWVDTSILIRIVSHVECK